MPALEPSQYTNLQSGLITEGAVAESRLPLDCVMEVQNMHFDSIGQATLRKGITQLGDTGSLTGNILGLFEFRDSGSGTNNRIIAVNGTVAYYLSGSTWTSKRSSLTSGSKARFSTFLDFVFMVNGTEATAIWDGAAANSFITTGNALNAPTGKFISNFRSRMWIAGNSTYPDRVYFSSLPSAAATPEITWDTDVSTGDWIDISPSDGENITGLFRSKTSLLVFKNNHIYRVYSITESEPDPKINVGTYSQESIVEAKDGVYFHHPTGFYKYTDGAVQEISRPIIDIVEAITLANYTEITGSVDSDHVSWSIGNVTVRGITYSNAVVRYTISTQTWTLYTYPTQFRFSSPYNDGSTLYRVVGGSNGKVYKLDTGLTDAGDEIQYSLSHRWFTFDGVGTTRKTLNKLAFFHEGGSGSKISYQSDADDLANPSQWTKTVGALSRSDTFFQNANVQGRRIRFRIAGASKGEPFTYQGFEVLEGQNELIQF